jgi:hypothetical protein
LDLDNHQIYYTKNGKSLGLAFEIPQNLQRAAFYPVRDSIFTCTRLHSDIDPLLQRHAFPYQSDIGLDLLADRPLCDYPRGAAET